MYLVYMQGAKRDFFKTDFVQKIMFKTNPEKIHSKGTFSTTQEKRSISLLLFLEHQGKNSIKSNKFSSQKDEGGLGRKRREMGTVEL